MVINRLAGYLSASTPLVGNDDVFTDTQLAIGALNTMMDRPRELYDALDKYYANNALYQRLQRALYDVGLPAESIRGLRNPSQLIVEFWAALLWPGDLPDALPIVTGDLVPNADALKAACEQVWQWSNWASRKQLFARRLGLYGDSWVKVAQPEGRPRIFLELLHPADVTDFQEDERGHLTYVRIDVQVRERDTIDGSNVWTHTEVWSKAELSYRRWRNDGQLSSVGSADLAQLGDPIETRTFQDMGCEDFVPITRTPFRDLGGKRGAGAIILLKDVIDEVNRKATSLAEQLFVDNQSNLFVESQSSPDRPAPPPRMEGRNGTSTDGGSIVVGRRQLWRVPAGWQLNYKIAPIDFDAALSVLNADLHHLSQLAPELLWWDTMDQALESGIARRMRLAPAIARVNEVRGSVESDHARQLMMAATIGRNKNVPGFQGLGAFEKGQLDITFAPREVVPLTEKEDADLAQSRATAYKTMIESNLPAPFALRQCYGLEDVDIEKTLNMAAGDLERMATAAQADRVDGVTQ